MLDKSTQEKLLNSYITVSEVVELTGHSRPTVEKKLAESIPDFEKNGSYFFLF